MNSFKCINCGENHNLETLIEFPEPLIISDITSGRSSDSLHIVSKNLVLINKEKVISQAEIEIEITDFDDNLLLLVWIEMKPELLANALGGNEHRTVEIDGKLLHPIPFYDKMNQAKVVVRINPEEDENPKLIRTIENSQLNLDLENGINTNKLINYFSTICSLNNKR